MKVLFAPSIPWLPQQKNYIDDASPDPRKFFRCLEDEGIECLIIDPNPRPWNPFGGMNALLQSLDPIRALQISVFHRDADVVVSVFEGAATSLGTLRRIFRSKSAIVMWDIGLTNWRLRNKIINFTLPKIDELFVLGTNQVQYVKDSFTSCQAITPIGHYVDSDFYSEAPIEMDGYVLSVGEDVGRDFSTFSEAVKNIRREVILKAGNPKINIESSNLKLIRERLSYSDLRDLYRKSSVVVVPTFSTNNASGVSTILEAYASGRPVVVTDNPGIRDFVIPGETCLVVPPQDAVALKDAIQRLLDDPKLCSRLATNARRFVEENCTITVFAKRFAHHLRAVDASNKRKRSKLVEPVRTLSS